MWWKWNERAQAIWLDGQSRINRRECAAPRLLFAFKWGKWFVCSLSFLILPLCQASTLSDYVDDGPVKASPIIVFVRLCSPASCSTLSHQCAAGAVERGHEVGISHFPAQAQIASCNSRCGSSLLLFFVFICNPTKSPICNFIPSLLKLPEWTLSKVASKECIFSTAHGGFWC